MRQGLLTVGEEYAYSQGYGRPEKIKVVGRNVPLNRYGAPRIGVEVERASGGLEVVPARNIVERWEEYWAREAPRLEAERLRNEERARLRTRAQEVAAELERLTQIPFMVNAMTYGGMLTRLSLELVHAEALVRVLSTPELVGAMLERAQAPPAPEDP